MAASTLETTARRDVSLLGIAKLTDDSTFITQVNAYYTHLEHSFTNPGSEFATLAISDFHYAEVRGIRAQQSLQSPFHKTEVGFQAEHSQYSSTGFLDSTQLNKVVNRSDRSVYSAFFNTVLRPSGLATLGASARFDKYGGESAPSLGAKLTVTPLTYLNVFGEYGRSSRFPTYQESSWADSTIQRPSPIKREEHTFARAGFSLSLDERNMLTVAAFDRSVHDAIIFQPSVTVSGSRAVRILNVSRVHTQGVAGSLNLRYGPFEFIGTALYQDYTEADTSKDLLPNLIMSGELTYRNKFFNEALDAKFGVRSRFMNRQRGMTFDSRLMLYEENSGMNPEVWTRLDAFVILKIGNAYITLSYENLLNAGYMITPVYPMPDRSFRLGVNWVFID